MFSNCVCFKTRVFESTKDFNAMLHVFTELLPEVHNRATMSDCMEYVEHYDLVPIMPDPPSQALQQHTCTLLLWFVP
jgi:hypothetical protein